ncbi:angiopoietin-2a [Larimichthys crocea]|uniref:angiopoietin-2a n=1 Tax=Larimichthys crocea TaxID=215358 RepID=UPI000F5FCC83|nr:angiopoietin-2 [Larimichthys crocea]
MKLLNVDLLVLSFCLGLGMGYSAAGKRQYQIQNGPCSYTFLLPEQDNCQTQSSNYNYQKDGPVDDESAQRLEQLEITMENNTQWLLKLENYIQDSMKQDLVQIQQTAVHNHTATMIEIGTNLLSQTAEQTRKLTNVEAQVIHHTTRLERRLLENSLSTNKLEKQLIVQTNEINKLNDKNSYLEKKVGDMEEQRQVELKMLQEEKEQLQTLIQRQTAIIGELEQQLLKVSSNNTVLHRQQQDLLETVNNLIHTISVGSARETKPVMMQDTPPTTFIDCAAVFKSGNTQSGVYILTLPNTTTEVKAFCDMETEGGGWTVLQKRFDGHVDFHRTWQEYKKGFGEPSGEFWLGNEFVSRLTSQQSYKLMIQLSDWEGNSGFSQYDQFSLDSEAQNYRIHLKGYSGTAGKISSIGQPGSDFSTKDADNDKCVCKCSQLTTGGWWFDACGPSNLNGMYYQQGQNSNRFNGIKWYYWKGSGYSLKSTTMMIRPRDFSGSV